MTLSLTATVWMRRRTDLEDAPSGSRKADASEAIENAMQAVQAAFNACGYNLLGDDNAAELEAAVTRALEDCNPGSVVG